MRQQAKRLFYIGKQLVSNNLPQIMQGLYKSRAFILEITIPQYINTLIMSLLDLFNTTKLSFIRQTISQILPLTAPIITSLPSRPQFITILTQSLKSIDPTIRILTLQIIKKLHNLFVKDSSIYHFLLGKLGIRGGENSNFKGKVKRDQVSVKEFLEIVGCLRVLVQNSEFLAGIFSNNLRELNQIGGVDLKIICYLCVYAKFQERVYEKVLKAMHQLCQPYLTKNIKFYKTYLTNLTIKSCNKNYLCIKYYTTSTLQTQLPQSLPQKINKIQYKNYNFLIPQHQPPTIDYLKLYNWNELLDLCYEHFSMYGRITGEIQVEVRRRILGDLGDGVVGFQTVLGSFYCMYNTRCLYSFDRNFAEKYKIKNSYGHNIKMLKIALTTCNYRLAKKIIEYLCNQDSQFKITQRNMTVLVLFEAYVDMHLEPSKENILGFFVIVSNLAICGQHRFLLDLVQKWKKRYEQQLEEQEGQNDQEYPQYLKQYQTDPTHLNNKILEQTQQKYQNSIKCQQQHEIIKQNTKTTMYFWDQENQPIYYIYFGKRTILDIFRSI